MATINEFSDILSAMEQNPELQEAMRNHVLGQEFQRLPAVVQQQGELLVQVQDRLTELASTLRDTTEQIASYALVSSRVITNTVERLDRVESDLAELKASQARLEASVQEIREIQARMEGDIAELKGDMAGVKADVAELKGDMAEVKADVAELKGGMVEVKADVAELKDTQDRMQATQDRMQGQLNNLTGTDYERKVARRAHRVARRHLDLRQVNVVYGITVADRVSVNIHELLDQATESGAISDEESDELERTDLILTGLTPAGESVYAVAEVSITIDDDDVDRARSRSRILQRASDTASRAVVIGTAISDANRQRAVQDGVAVVIVEE
jgi:chromosome segregation ATPase